VPPHFAYVATLPCETLTSAKQTLEDKLQGSVATYLRCSRVVITKLRKVYFWFCKWKNLKSVNIWRSYKQERDCLVHLCPWPTHWPLPVKLTATFLCRLTWNSFCHQSTVCHRHEVPCGKYAPNYSIWPKKTTDDRNGKIQRYDTIRDAILTCARKPT